MTAGPYWTCRRPGRDGSPYLIAVTLATGALAAREVMCPTACVAPCAVVSPDLLVQIADLRPGEIREIEVAALPSWRDLHGDRLLSRQYCEDIGYDPT